MKGCGEKGENHMAMEIYSRSARWEVLRTSAATSVGANYSKMGTAVGSDAAEATTTSTVIKATAHVAAVGDQIIMTSGTYDGEAREVSEVAANTITVSAAFSGAPSAADTFNIIRPISIDQENEGNPIVCLIARSTLNQAVLISFDGTNNHLVVPGSSDLVLDLKTNGRHLSERYVSGATVGKYIWVKVESTAPTSGSLYVMGYK